MIHIKIQSEDNAEMILKLLDELKKAMEEELRQLKEEREEELRRLKKENEGEEIRAKDIECYPISDARIAFDTEKQRDEFKALLEKEGKA